MLNKLKIVAAITAFLTLTACSDNAPDIPKNEVAEDTVKDALEQEVTEGTVKDIPEFNITKDEVARSDYGDKRTVEVELQSRVDEPDLRALAKQIYELSDEKFEPTFIGYRIAGDHENQTYWATTHYNPELRVDIAGASASDYEKVKNMDLPEGEVLGSWLVSWGAEYKSTAYQKDGKTYIHNVHSDGSNGDYIYELSQSNKGTKLQDEKGKERDEYFIINNKGELEFWSGTDNYYTAPKV